MFGMFQQRKPTILPGGTDSMGGQPGQLQGQAPSPMGGMGGPRHRRPPQGLMPGQPGGAMPPVPPPAQGLVPFQPMQPPNPASLAQSQQPAPDYGAGAGGLGTDTGAGDDPLGQLKALLKLRQPGSSMGLY